MIKWNPFPASHSIKRVVQESAVRPFVYGLHGPRPEGLGLNTSSGVSIEVEGPSSSSMNFSMTSFRKAPPLSRIEQIESNPFAKMICPI